MCYASGSIEQFTRTCIMCKVYPPRQVGCPHQPLALCRNRQNHPRFDVVHFRSAELDLFNGCGYCKWANQHNLSPTTTEKTWFNTGWPGCCRPPKPSEYIYIKGLNEWLAVNKIHGTPIPPDAGHVAPNSLRSVSSSKKDQSRPSLNQIVSAFEKGSSMSTPGTNSTLRRKRSKSVSQSIDRDLELPTKTVTARNACLLPQVTVDAKSSASLKARRFVDEKERSALQIPIPSRLSPSQNIPMLRASSVITSSSRSSSSTADSMTTVTSEGFTDYLSDESDQELQRQAEARAAELAIAKHEKDEFDAALQTVRHLSLQPPPEWNPQLPVPRPTARFQVAREAFNGPQSIQVAISNTRH